MPIDNFISQEEDRTAIPEAKIVKYQYLFDYYDAKEFIVNYIKTGEKRNILKATNSLLGLWLQIKPEFKKKEFELKMFEDLSKLDYFLMHREKIPSYDLLLRFWFGLQRKLKAMKILDITFPEADIGRDFQRSF